LAQVLRAVDRDDTYRDLAPGAVHIWLIRVLEGSARSPAVLSMLSASERRRAKAFREERHADRFCTAHASLRLLLGDYLGRSPIRDEYITRCAFCGSSSHGKPRLPDCSGQLEFSLSTSDGLVALAFQRAGPVGIDIEATRATLDESLLRAILSPSELSELSNLRPSDCALMALRCWVRKEALLKALGTGLAVELTSIETGSHGERRVAFRHPRTGRVSSWWIVDVACPPGHVGSLVVRSDPVTTKTVVDVFERARDESSMALD
jgi:4'-phosphopantetheinyl transferase